MPEQKTNFFVCAEKNALDEKSYDKLENNMSPYERRYNGLHDYYTGLDILRERGAYIRSKGMDNVEKHLKEFEENFVGHEGKVFWAFDEKEAILIINQILNKTDARNMLSVDAAILEEISLYKQARDGRAVVKTSIKGYIEQAAETDGFESARKNSNDIAEALGKRFNVELDNSIRNIVRFINARMQDAFVEADVVVTGADFLIADVGGVVLSGNEGNIGRICAFPRTHIVVAGYDKVISSINDLELMLTLLSSSGSGIPLNVYNNILFGPRKREEQDGPEQMFVIILNNGRDLVLKHRIQRKALNCIECGSCSRFSPEWKVTGTRICEAPYAGPIGAIKVPLMLDSKKYRYLTYFSSLSAAPERHCPVRIPLNDLLLYNRALFTKERRAGEFSMKNTLFQQSLRLLSIRSALNASGGRKSRYLASLIKPQWGKGRALPKFAKKSFNEIYRKRTGEEGPAGLK